MDQNPEKCFSVRKLPDVLREIEKNVQSERTSSLTQNQNIKDFRWKFDQVSAKMNQAIYNDDTKKIHDNCLRTVSVLVEILSRS